MVNKSKELDRANRHYLTVLQALRTIKEQPLKITLKANTAIIGQNQIVQANNHENNRVPRVSPCDYITLFATGEKKFRKDYQQNLVISPNDLGVFQLADYSQKVNINDLTRQAKKELKTHLLRSSIELLGYNLALTTSKTRFNGERTWFVCPLCGKRVGVIYKQQGNNKVGCFKCLNLKYRKQRYKGMIEATTKTP